MSIYLFRQLNVFVAKPKNEWAIIQELKKLNNVLSLKESIGNILGFLRNFHTQGILFFTFLRGRGAKNKFYNKKLN